MMSGRAINYEQASTYYEHSADYYTGHQSHYDKWHGKLAKRLRLTGELSKGQFETFCQNMAEEERRKRIGFDATFSAPKSISLALAESGERREELIRIHQTAVERVLAEIEKNHLRTRSNRKKLSARNMACGEFVHFLNRNNELDLHSHCVILNQTDTDGKILALDFDKLLEHQKILGLMYRQELAHELLAAGYELEITNSREGYFELKGFDRETVMTHSTRRQEILAEAERQGAMTAQGKMLANLATRKAKDKSVHYEDVLAEVKQSLYDTGKIKIEYHRKEQEQNGRFGRRDDGRGGSFARRGTGGDNADGRIRSGVQHEHLEADAGQSSFADIVEDWSEMPQSLAQGYGLPKLPQFPLDVPARRSRLLLSSDTIRHLASLQTEKEYHLAVQRAHRQERRRRIDEIAKTAVEHLSRETFAFSIPEVCHRIMAEGVLERISQKEAQAAMERLKLVKLGRMERGKNRKDVYVTTEANIRQEHDIIERMKQGKGIIPRTLSMEQSKELLNRVATGKNLTPNEEQTAVLHHIMTSADQFLCVQGLAGTGKTYTMNALRELCEAENIKVRGVCFTGKVADGLKKESGIPSFTIHSFLGKLEKESGIKADSESKDGIRQHWDFSKVKPTQEREIWIVDEAGLVDNHLMDELQQAAIAYNAQVVFSGDYDQLPPVGAGEPFKALIEAGAGTAYLEDIRRQRDLELLEAVRQSVKGDTLKTYEILEKRGNFREIGNRDDRREEIRYIMGQTRLEDYKNQLLLVSTNGSRKEYNDMIRRNYIRTGQLEEGTTFKITSHNGEKDVTEERRFARRDRIIFTANNSRLGVLKGSEFVSFVLLKLTLYCLLVYFLGNWGDAIANFAKDMFTGFGGLMMGESGEAAMKAISDAQDVLVPGRAQGCAALAPADPMDIVSKGAHIVAPIYNEMFKIHSVLDLMSKIDLWLPSFFFAAILTICFFAVAISITLAYLEFYTVMVFSFGTFFLSGLHQTRKYAANGINGIFAVSIKLMFYCMFSLMLQMVLSNMVVEDFYTVHRGETPGIMAEAPADSEAITSIDQLMAHIRAVESSGRYYVDNGLGYFGAYQIDYANYDNWTHWTEMYVRDGGYLEDGPVMENEPHGPAWTPANQDNVARYILTGYYNEYGSYEMAARCWNQGEGGRNNSDADIYWAKVSGTSPVTGAYSTPTVTINMILLFKVTFVALMFVLMGSKIGNIIMKDFGGSGFRFTNE